MNRTKTNGEDVSSKKRAGQQDDAFLRLAEELGRIVGRFLAEESAAGKQWPASQESLSHETRGGKKPEG